MTLIGLFKFSVDPHVGQAGPEIRLIEKENKCNEMKYVVDLFPFKIYLCLLLKYHIDLQHHGLLYNKLSPDSKIVEAFLKSQDLKTSRLKNKSTVE